MSFDEKIAGLRERLPEAVEHIETEEATKNALIMPFISALGYDVFNPKEVIPEFTADVGTKKGEKVDYAIVQDGAVSILIECKKAGTNLSQETISQLHRYFHVTKARIAILTDGVKYQFFSDLEKPNVMDSSPFLELDLSQRNLKRQVLKEVKKLAKEDFNLNEVLENANVLKYTSAIKKIFAAQYESPDEEFVRFFFSKVCPGSKFMASAKEQFSDFVATAFQQFVNEKISERLETAADIQNEVKELPQDTAQPEPESTDGIVTTEEELEAYRIVLAITRKSVPSNRIVHRDTKSYMGILLDDNNRKPICRLHFNTRQKYLGLFDDDKKESRQPISDLSEIYDFSEQLNSTVERYLKDE